MGSKWKGPILNVIRVATHNPSRLLTKPINFWAWAPYILVACCSTWAWGVTAWPSKRSSLCRCVPLWPRWCSWLAWALTPNLGFCRLGWCHIARSTWAGRSQILSTGSWAWIKKFLVHEAHVDITWAWSCNLVHFYGFLRHVICGRWGCWSKIHISGLTWPHVLNMVWLRWHPTIQPVPTPLGFLTLIRIISSYVIAIRVCLQVLLLLLLFLQTNWFQNENEGNVFVSRLLFVHTSPLISIDI